MKNTKVKRKFYLNKFMRGIGLVVCLTLIITLFIKSSATGNLQTEFKQVVVKRGDTLWDIARVNKGNESNMEEVMYAIRQINNLKNSDLHPGQTLKVSLNF